MTEEMILARDRFNLGVTQPGNRVMLELLGQPRGQYDQECRGVTNPNLRALLETRQIGPIRVTMIKPALDSLERILGRLQETEPDIYAAVGTAGSLCVRLIRGSRSSISNHSWGTAVDITLENRLDEFADGSTQFGLLLIAELFNEEGWYWGATYSREDSMHFEVGVEALRRWAEAGEI
ncbi:MAG: M15 family metallopeptidase [Pseudomonadota bacterium]